MIVLSALKRQNVEMQNNVPAAEGIDWGSRDDTDGSHFCSLFRIPAQGANGRSHGLCPEIADELQKKGAPQT